MEVLTNTLENTNVKYAMICMLIFIISTINPPLNNILRMIYNSPAGQVIFLILIVYYSQSNLELGLQISVLLTLLYVLLLHTLKTENHINNYGKMINDNLVGGNIEDLLSSTEESNNFDVNEENLDEKIERVIQEEIVLNKKTYDEKIKDSKKLGATQYKLNKDLEEATKDLELSTDNYKKSEDEYNKIMKEVNMYDTNNDGVVDYNDNEPMMEEQEVEGESMEQQMGGGKNHLDTLYENMENFENYEDSMYSSI